jgi:hypothetical protein
MEKKPSKLTRLVPSKLTKLVPSKLTKLVQVLQGIVVPDVSVFLPNFTINTETSLFCILPTLHTELLNFHFTHINFSRRLFSTLGIFREIISLGTKFAHFENPEL